ncbi:hypothetical protein N0V93_006260 [Gnomoniopsis smithogilvyi]|uniref:Rhodopsin domain-containing protein n=1 Tax=Gnomoniopsis smithogilvyi TaxID=1191159 RepID=A0A9W8YRK2_9PEZI|nr:hypothetical protein N0V93_006260 [Gnomoniopsis smithogilvyi]
MSTQQPVQGATPPPPGRVPNFEHPEDVLHTINFVSQVLAVALITPIVGLRLWTRWRITPPFLIDDWFCLIAYILSILYSCTAFAMNKFGGGYHSWEISAGNFENYLKALYADTLVYGPNAWFVKVTLLLVVIRVFSINRTFVIFWYAFIAAMTGYYVPVLFIKMNICQPINGYWDPSVPARCLDQRAVFVADTVVSAVTDLAVLLAPVPVIRAIKMSFAQMVRVYLLLGAGGVATVASFIRMYLVIQLQKSEDQTVDFVRFNLLGTAEVAIGLACACMPTINQLYQSRNKSDQRNRPRSRAIQNIKFLKKSDYKRHFAEIILEERYTGPSSAASSACATIISTHSLNSGFFAES